MTPYGTTAIERHVYQSSKGGGTYVPLDRKARIFGKATPGLTKLINWKYANLGVRSVIADMKENHGVKFSKVFIQECNHRLGNLICEHEQEWEYALPEFEEEIKIVSVSRDGTTTPILHEGYRETMTGTISLHNAEGERLHTIYTGVAPESGKQSFDVVFSAEIKKIQAKFGESSTWVGIADGTADNWSFLERYTQVQTIDFYHATEYLAAYAKKAYRSKKTRDAWRANACHELKHTPGAAQSLLAQMRQYGEEQGLLENKKSPVTKAVTYFSNHHEKMRYAEWKEEHLPIGSGVVEAACKTLVKQRLSISGCRWDIDTVDDILAVRGLILTPGRYEQLWKNIDSMPYDYIK